MTLFNGVGGFYALTEHGLKFFTTGTGAADGQPNFENTLDLPRFWRLVDWVQAELAQKEAEAAAFEAITSHPEPLAPVVPAKLEKLPTPIKKPGVIKKPLTSKP